MSGLTVSRLNHSGKLTIQPLRRPRVDLMRHLRQQIMQRQRARAAQPQYNLPLRKQDSLIQELGSEGGRFALVCGEGAE